MPLVSVQVHKVEIGAIHMATDMVMDTDMDPRAISDGAAKA